MRFPERKVNFARKTDEERNMCPAVPDIVFSSVAIIKPPPWKSNPRAGELTDEAPRSLALLVFIGHV